MLYVVPIEPLEERYSKQWLEWTVKHLDDHEVPYLVILPESYGEIKTGKFLDVYGTNVFKNRQMEMILTLFNEGNVQDGDVFWFHDMWFPGLEMLFYLRDALKIKFKIFGCLHAGTYDINDYLSQCGMDKWGEDLENAWLKGVDGVFVATQYHAGLLFQKRIVSAEKIHVTCFPFYPREFMQHRLPDVESTEPHSRIVDEGEVTIVFPHRLDAEKNPQMFDELAETLNADKSLKKYQFDFIKTKEVCSSKDEYYDLLSTADIAVSFAYQETWGIAMQEATVLGCIPVVPLRLSYMEMYSPGGKSSLFFDGTVEHCAETIKDILNNPQEYDRLRFESALRFESNGASALSNMLYFMGWRTF